MLKYILLGFLDYGPMTGYMLKQTIDTSTGFFWHAHHSQIYTTLRQMEKEGLVTSTTNADQDALRKRLYFISDHGRNVLIDWQDTPMFEMSQVKEDFLVRIFFSGKREPHKILEELNVQKRLHQEVLNNYIHLRENILDHNHKNSEGMEKNHKFWNLPLEMGFLYEKIYIEWLEIAIRTVEGE